MVDLDHLLDLTFSTPGMHISASAPLTTPAALASAEVSIRYRNTTSSENNPSSSSSSSPPAKSGDKREKEKKKKKSTIWTDAYQPGTFVPLLSAASDFDFHSSSSSSPSSPSSLLTTAGDATKAGDETDLKGGEEEEGRKGDVNIQRFRAWLKSRCVLSATDAITSHHHGQAAIVSFINIYIYLPFLTLPYPLIFFLGQPISPPSFLLFSLLTLSFSSFFISLLSSHLSFSFFLSLSLNNNKKRKRGKERAFSSSSRDDTPEAISYSPPHHQPSSHKVSYTF